MSSATRVMELIVADPVHEDMRETEKYVDQNVQNTATETHATLVR